MRILAGFTVIATLLTVLTACALFPPVALGQNILFYVPEAGSLATPLVGEDAVAFFRMCPNNDGGASLPNNARIKIYCRDANNNPIEGIPASSIYVRFNGGTAAQGFTLGFVDSIIANSTWNVSPLCPDVRFVYADAPTNHLGVTYITFTGADSTNPGVGVRNSSRKWGHYDSALPVNVGDLPAIGRLTYSSPDYSYVLRIKNFDLVGGLDATYNQGEVVTGADYNFVSNNVGVHDALSYWRDFDSSGSVTSGDVNMLNAHLNHNCTYPNNP